jgi:DNA-binding CsgD family transcriptional regulator
MGSRKRNMTVVSLIETAYADEASEQAWLEAIVACAKPDIDQGFGACAYIYDAVRTPLEVGTVVTDGAPFLESMVRGTVAQADEAYVAKTWRTLSFATASEIAPLREVPQAKPFVDMGIEDMLAINAYDPSGFGVWLGAPLSRVTRLRPAEAKTWMRVAAHLATAFRLRRRPESLRGVDRAAAVLSPEGKVEHASGDAALVGARKALQESVGRIERARGSLRETDPDSAVEGWQALTDARWSIVDHFERGGRRYLVAVENAPAVAGPDVLSTREQQVLSAAAAGRSNKLIAYELGLSDSTVRVLLARAAKKLRVRTRAELIALFRAHRRASAIDS